MSLQQAKMTDIEVTDDIMNADMRLRLADVKKGLSDIRLNASERTLQLTGGIELLVDNANEMNKISETAGDTTAKLDKFFELLLEKLAEHSHRQGTMWNKIAQQETRIGELEKNAGMGSKPGPSGSK